MTLSEALVAALILGISSQLSLQSWASTIQAAAAAQALEQRLEHLEQRLLASRRMLQSATVVDRSCRFDRSAVAAVLERLPSDPATTQQLEPDPQLEGVWLRLASSASQNKPLLKRQLLLTPAGLGHCSSAEKL